MERIGRNTPTRGAKLALTIEQAGSGAHQAIDQLSQAARPAVSRAAFGAHRLVDSVAGTTNRVAQRLEETATRLKDAEQRLVGASSGYVREHPFRSVGIALAAGFLVSRLVISRNSSGSGENSPAED